jgi:hypothetical protein
MTKAFRHGEIAFIKISDLPEGLKQEKSKVIMQGSHNNSHSFDNGKLYFKKVDTYIFGYFMAKNTILFHPDHGAGKGIKKAKLPDGIYELRKQQEFINSELKPVID